ncbi:transposase [Candidatus Paracaedimonas acanthamoebae]|nr:transposase [Candidatus Paracaedimonas acanthamoebae]
MCPKVDHRSHKRLNNRAENTHQPTRRKEKILMKFKSLQGVQRLLSLMGKVRNIFSVEVGRYKKKASDQRLAFAVAKAIWLEAALEILAA